MSKYPIQIITSGAVEVRQKFSFFTEQLWSENKSVFPDLPAELFSGKKDEHFIVAEKNAVHFLIGLPGVKPHELQNAASKFSYEFRQKILATPTQLDADQFSADQTEALLTGLFLGTYAFEKAAAHVFFNDNFSLLLSSVGGNEILKIQQNIQALCEGQFAAMDWLNRPQNQKKVGDLTSYLAQTAEKYGLKITVYNRQQCDALGLGAFLAVNQGSAQEAAFTVLEYDCSVPTAKTIGLVGKCVLFDTGGISIKPSENLHYMKSDMGGAAAVIGTLIAAAARKISVNLKVILPITDNAVSGSALVPSDVVKAYNGKTIEILNTDAEGRLTLADGLAYLAKNFRTDAVIDLATLTGSAVRMFGPTCAAYFSNNEELTALFSASAARTQQRFWQLPLWDDWSEELQSDVAELKNISLKPYGDCIVAAKFLEQFINSHPAWAHFDIAGVAFGNVAYMKDKGATGYGVQLLLDFLENF